MSNQILMGLYFLVSLWLGYWCVVYFYKPGTLDLPNLLLCSAGGLGIGLGFNSLLVFLFLMSHIPIQPLIFAGIDIGIGTFFFLLSKKTSKFQIRLPDSLLILIPILLYLLIFLFTMNKFLFDVKSAPHGAWDAWAIWNFHAKFLYAGGDDWLRLFDPAISTSHTDYPLLTPAAIALGWFFVGSMKTYVPIFIAGFFTFGSAVIVLSAVTKEKGLFLGLLSSGILLSTPEFLKTGYYQYADTPLGFYFLLGIVFLFFFIKFRQPRLLILSGLAVGLTAWTKNEGLLYILIFSAAIGLVFVYEFGKNKKRDFSVFSFFVGLLPVLAVALLFKLIFAPGNDIISNLSFTEILLKVVDVDRIRTVLSLYGENVGVLNGGYLLILYGLTLLVFGWTGLSKQILVTFGIVAAAMIAYILVYLVTPQDVVWHIGSSLTRLFMHVFPSILFCLWMTIKDGSVIRAHKTGFELH